MRNSREFNKLRKVEIIPDFCPAAQGSVLLSMGNTKVICAVSVINDVPDHAKNKNTGWLTAEYNMLPYSTSPRIRKTTGKKDGRSVEIQRLIGRSLRGVVNLGVLQNYTISIDCDVLQADGGTRTASITGACIALKRAFKVMIESGMITENPMTRNVAAVSVGYIKDQLLLDLDYSEDSQADVDMNIVMDGNFDMVEIQGTGENSNFSISQLNDMIYLAKEGITKLFEIQNRF